MINLRHCPQVWIWKVLFNFLDWDIYIKINVFKSPLSDIKKDPVCTKVSSWNWNYEHFQIISKVGCVVG